MTYVSLAVLEEMRKEGLAPAGGPASPEELDAALPRLDTELLSPSERTESLTRMLRLAWDHPKDVQLSSGIAELAGHRVAPSTISLAASHLRNRESPARPEVSAEVAEMQHSAFDELVHKVEQRFGGNHQRAFGFMSEE